MAGCRRVAIEVKSEWQNLVLRGATYARALFYSNWTRTFALVIGINRKSRGIRFMFFSPRWRHVDARTFDGMAKNPRSQNSSGFCARFSAGASQRRQGSFQQPHPIARLDASVCSRVVLAYEGVPIESPRCRERRRAVQYHRPHPRRLKVVRTCEDPNASKSLHAECDHHLPAMSERYHRDPRGQRDLLPRARRAPLPR